MNDEARAEAERHWDDMRDPWLSFVYSNERQAYAAGAEWQAERDAERIAELQADIASERRLREQIRRQRDRAVDKLRPVGQERDAWQERAEAAEARLAKVQELAEKLYRTPDEPEGTQYIPYGVGVHESGARLLAVLDGEAGS